LEKIKRFIHQWAWTLLIVFLSVGLFYPAIGVGALICMLAPVVVSFFKGRRWCANYCPRGSFNDIILSKISRKIKIPNLLKKQWFKFGFLTILMGGFFLQIYLAWGSFASVGSVFVRMVLITTLLAIILGAVFSQRTWCAICPMGTLASYTSRIKPVSKKPNIAVRSHQCSGCNKCNLREGEKCSNDSLSA